MPFGAVSNTLIAQLSERFCSGHQIYTWLDPDGTYQDFVRELRQDQQSQKNARSKYLIIPFEGSYLEMMLEIDQKLSGVYPPLTLIYLPFHTKEKTEASPLLEMLLAGTEFFVPFDELIRSAAAGRTSLNKTENFLEKKNTSLLDANQWLKEEMQENDGQFWSQLHSLTSPSDLIGAIIGSRDDGFAIPPQFKLPANQQTFWRYFEVQYGLPAEWLPKTDFLQRLKPEQEPRFYDLLYAVASWALVVEFIDDVGNITLPKAFNFIPQLDERIRKKSSSFASQLREDYATYYQTIADETEAQVFFTPVRKIKAKDLGEIDTFRFEEEAYFQTSLVLLGQDRFKTVLKWANSRLEGDSFWLKESPARRSRWDIIKTCCHLGISLQSVPKAMPSMNSIDEAAEYYTKRCALVDQAHRHFEQIIARNLTASLPQFSSLQRLVDHMRTLYSTWLNNLARDFNKLCLEYGFMPSDSRQQRNIFYQILKPLTKKGKVAFFMVDALRYEMAQELLDKMKLSGQDKYSLSPYFAELPTNTNVCMNLLAPVLQGNQIELVMRNGEIECVQGNSGYQIRVPEHRRQAIKAAIGGNTSPKISVQEILDMDLVAIRKKFSHSKIAVIPYLGIDKAGERNEGPKRFPDTLRKLRKTWQKLRQADFQHFLFVSDHGFLLLDPDHERAKGIPRGRPVDNNRRHIITEHATDHENEVRVRLRDLNYKVNKDYHLVLPEDARIFENGFSGKNYAHGGNSLQERIIPVLQISHPAPIKKTTEQLTPIVKPRKSSNPESICLDVLLEKMNNSLDFMYGSIEVEIHTIDQVTAQVHIQQFIGEGSFSETKLELKSGIDCTLLLKLEDGRTGSSRLEFRFPNNNIEPFVTKEYFPIQTSLSMQNSGQTEDEVEEPIVEVKSSQQVDWLENIDDVGARKIFQYLMDHSSISEAEISNLLGSSRGFRKFRRNLAKYAPLVPFELRIEVVNGVSQLVRE